ncbi:hypothetical protein E2C01_036692 [Portunus trituberculatus]|uniref:Uncharacterized protein n=1 Tax=Portunus trituberculatus TaxID=210409 RepID=A0A5B7FCN0_PORTR|nr:hypothetical protein [Portunus trituberculatus]
MEMVCEEGVGPHLIILSSISPHTYLISSNLFHLTLFFTHHHLSSPGNSDEDLVGDAEDDVVGIRDYNVVAEAHRHQQHPVQDGDHRQCALPQQLPVQMHVPHSKGRQSTWWREE